MKLSDLAHYMFIYGSIHVFTVSSCAVSRDGARLYVTDQITNKLVTMSRDGTVISTLTEPELDKVRYFEWASLLIEKSVHAFSVSCFVHVTEMGQVLVCGRDYNSVLQVDRDGKQILSEVFKRLVDEPTSFYYSRNTGTLILGLLKFDSIYLLT